MLSLTNPNSLSYCLVCIFIISVMYFLISHYNYIINVIAHTLIKTCFMPIFNALISLMIPWSDIGTPFSIVALITNFVYGLIIVYVFEKILKYTDYDFKLFFFYGYVVNLFLEFLFNIIILNIFG